MPATDVPDAAGRFGPFGGRYVPETLTGALDELTAQYEKAVPTQRSRRIGRPYRHYVGRPSPLYYRRTSEPAVRRGSNLPQARRPQSHRRPQDQQHARPGAADAADGQAAGDRRNRGRPARRGHGHGLRRFGLECVVYMGEEDIRRQRPNVFSMKLLGAEVRPVSSGSRTLRDAINEAFRDWMSSVETTHYCLGSVVGPHPFPRIVRDFQSVIGRETRAQCLEQLGPAARRGRGLRRRRQQRRRHVLSLHRRRGGRAGGRRGGRAVRQARRPCRHALLRPPGVLHGSFSYVLQDDDGQTADVHSVSAGLDYPGTGRSTAIGRTSGRVRYTSARDDEALAAFDALARNEGILPALESSHAVAKAMKLAAARRPRGGDRRLPVRPGRQGRGRNRPAARRGGFDAAMSAIDTFSAQLRSPGRKALMPFVTAGDPDLDFTAALLRRAGRPRLPACANWASPTAIRWPTGR